MESTNQPQSQTQSVRRNAPLEEVLALVQAHVRASSRPNNLINFIGLMAINNIISESEYSVVDNFVRACGIEDFEQFDQEAICWPTGAKQKRLDILDRLIETAKEIQ